MSTIKGQLKEDLLIEKTDVVISLLRDLLVLNLGQNGVPQLEIQKLVGGDMNRINHLLKRSKTRK